MAQATLTVWRFDSPNGADDASVTLQALAQQSLLTLHDAATVSWEDGRRKPRTRQLNPTVAAGALGGTFWGMLFGLVFFMPLLGAALGAATGALAGSLTDVGIDDRFINNLRDRITPGTSALFLLSSDEVVDRVRDAFGEGVPAELIFTNLSSEQEAALHKVFDEM